MMLGWGILIAVILLALHWKGPNAVWGGATSGVILGVIVAIVAKDWSCLSWFFIWGTIAGVVFEWVGRVAESHQKA